MTRHGRTGLLTNRHSHALMAAVLACVLCDNASAAASAQARPAVVIDLTALDKLTPEEVPTLTSSADKLAGANADVEATTNTISPMPIGTGFRMLFDRDRTTLSVTAQRLLDELVAQMAGRPELRLSVQAYAGGSPETASRSRLLSLERALAVRSYLYDRGIRASRIDMRAMGNTFIDGPPERVDLLLLRR